MSPAPDTGLRCALGLRESTAMVVGTIIGASIFVQPSEITGSVPSIGGILLVWFASGILTLFGALACAELASIFTRTGGVYIYLKEAYSPVVGFLWGWAMFWTMHSGIIAAIAVVFARYAGYFLPLGDVGTRAVAILAILLLSAINLLGVKHGSALQTWFTIGKLAAVVLIVAAGWLLGSRLPEHFVPSATVAEVTPGGFFTALIAGLFAFGGWHMVTYNAEETHEPRRTIPRALLAGVLIVTACYVALNAVYLYVLPLDTVAASTRVAADAADALLGSGGGAVMAGLVVFSTFGALAGIILAGPRVYYAMAQDGLLFEKFARVHPRYRTPHLAIALQAVWSSLLVATGTYRALFTRVVFTEWIFFALMAAGLILLRRRAAAQNCADLRADYRIWGYPYVPLIFIASCAAIVASHIYAQPRDAAIGLALVLAGLPVYYLWARRG
jgi:APA family basic amino acid/polyamine antiporter